MQVRYDRETNFTKKEGRQVQVAFQIYVCFKIPQKPGEAGCLCSMPSFFPRALLRGPHNPERIPCALPLLRCRPAAPAPSPGHPHRTKISVSEPRPQKFRNLTHAIATRASRTASARIQRGRLPRSNGLPFLRFHSPVSASEALYGPSTLSKSRSSVLLARRQRQNAHL